MSKVQTFQLKAPCKNCPFRKDDGAIELNEGRFSEIESQLVKDDNIMFLCHKHLGDSFDENDHVDDDSDGDHETHLKPSIIACAGAEAYRRKIGRMSVAMRFAIFTNKINEDHLTNCEHLVVDKNWRETQPQKI